MLYFDLLATILKHLSQIKNIENTNENSKINWISRSKHEQNKYLLKMMYTIKTFGNPCAAKASFPKINNPQLN